MPLVGAGWTAGSFLPLSRTIGKRQRTGGKGGAWVFKRQRGAPGAWRNVGKAHYTSRATGTPAQQRARARFVQANARARAAGLKHIPAGTRLS